jgi:hypothetical protein
VFDCHHGILPELRWQFFKFGETIMKKVKVLLMSLACTVALAASAAAFTIDGPLNVGQNAEACCDSKDCCKSGDKDMSCCKKKKKGKNAHACCKTKNGAECCCKGDACPMPNKKAGTTSGN